MQEKAVDERMGWQSHGLDTIALVPVAEGKAPLTVVDIDKAVVGDGHAVGVAAEIVEYLLRACHGALGVDHPRLVIEAVDTLS